jgi:hypothetical protein
MSPQFLSAGVVEEFEKFERQAVQQKTTGTITGKIVPSERVVSIKAIDRALNLEYPVEFDAATGRFKVDNLMTNTFYDLVVTLKSGKIFGIGLQHKDAALERLKDETPEGEKFTQKDLDEIKRKGLEPETFTNKNRYLLVHGKGDHCQTIVEMMRDTPFYAEKGDEIIYRLEKWYWQRQYGGWEKLRNADEALFRTREPVAEFNRKFVVVVPELGGIWVDAEGKSKPVEYRIPETFDPSKGHVATN